jgi:hypothetical protein
MVALPSCSDTREPRANARGRSGAENLYGAVPSAHDAGRDGRCDVPLNPAQIAARIRAASSHAFPDNSPGTRASFRERQAGRERPSLAAGGVIADGRHRGPHAPLSLHQLSALPGGRHRAPSDRGDGTEAQPSAGACVTRLRPSRARPRPPGSPRRAHKTTGDNIQVRTRPPRVPPLRKGSR